LVLGDVDGSYSLATSMSVIAEQLEGRIDATTAKVVCWDPILRLLLLCRTTRSWTPT
jgi:hypothetical protein